MAEKRRKKRSVVNMRLKAPVDIHASIVIHQSRLNKSSEYDVSLEDAHIDVLKHGLQTLKV